MPSKAWAWGEAERAYWLDPSEESYYIAQRWKRQGVKRVLDFGCGLGRHAVYFARQGFEVSAFDLSGEAVEHLRDWARRENLAIGVTQADMLSLPYPDFSFDAIFAYHVLSHTDSVGIVRIIAEMKRVLKPGGRVFLTLCSKDTWSFREAGYPMLDENTLVKTDDGPEKGIPHFYVSLDDIFALFGGFQFDRIRHVDDCYFEGKARNSKHYYITAALR